MRWHCFDDVIFFYKFGVCQRKIVVSTVQFDDCSRPWMDVHVTAPLSALARQGQGSNDAACMEHAYNAFLELFHMGPDIYSPLRLRQFNRYHNNMQA